MSKKEKSYKIKVPVYSSELLENVKGLFGGHSYNDMINYLDDKLNNYTQKKPKLSRKKRNKVKEIEIQNIEKIEGFIGEIPIRLFKISAYNTNLIDGYVETKEKITLTKNDKLGSDTNFMLLYPKIIGLNENEYQYQWKILLYEDPTKENRELVSICKIVLEKVFEIKICNIKLDRVLKILKEKKVISELTMQFNSQSNDENEVETKLRKYLVNANLKKIRYENFKDVPFNKVEEIISDKNYESEYQKRTIKFLFNKKEIKLTNEFQEAKEIIKETVEEIFNSEIIIHESEIESLFDTEFILEKLSPIIQEYLSENE
ncbi:hypothetical protein J2Q11_13870 [Tenacibaculum finnmarkense genomovar finnmarkense]|uniref:hypothetical protein n=1 Tax=Tenacibaculum finnmarkense TaxID=2781243 RepID=UPI001E5DB4AC|nr:hypothetical protein [Tenacibaculum finnmarkense]MCD8418810.1 hypothetical protein [Tenacibaculum finnmarkense genomovar finnmarkense]MCG8187112.1 hypothetical protein [Tenacibaculum finnmarkense genomovar finnmarkense]MCG8203679.1 hypothetical protein [Tenacibaculum finnmarkense genomovar finnmarkense]MCG8211156.1 hypothetical protein [Tenacibaculum finnmarkense genomovar finnmarkense]MCG8213903.1 hypothetical protein [Tenacibaculum finnmarkense genomovar finnmarkense]